MYVCKKESLQFFNVACNFLFAILYCEISTNIHTYRYCVKVAFAVAINDQAGRTIVVRAGWDSVDDSRDCRSSEALSLTIRRCSGISVTGCNNNCICPTLLSLDREKTGA